MSSKYEAHPEHPLAKARQMQKMQGLGTSCRLLWIMVAS